MVKKWKFQSSRSANYRSSKKVPSGLLTCSFGRCATFSSFQVSDSEDDETETEETTSDQHHRQQQSPKLKVSTMAPRSPLSSNTPSKQPTTPRGYLAMYVGEEKKRFLVKTNFLNHPLFSVLLEKAKDEFGFEQQGALNIPCDIAFFQHIMLLVESNDPMYRNVTDSILLSPVNMEPGSPLLRNPQLSPAVFR